MSVVVANRRSIGVNFSSRGESEVLIWAPRAKQAVVVMPGTETRIVLRPEARGYFSCITPDLRPGDRYLIELDGRTPLPDPASMLQPDGVSGPSEVFSANAFRWTDNSWKNVPLKEYILYEMHVGTFTPGGGFKDVIERLPHLKALGITAIELMPVAEFPGERNWGYDGVFPFAAHHAYGGPHALQTLIDACHAEGIAVVLDVVYNHLGPEGNVLDSYGPYFTEKYRTPWGAAINFDDAGCDEVRKFFIENALMWFRDFHVDALRLDAVHAIRDFSAVHLLQELREYVNALSAETARSYYLIAECDLNDPKYLESLPNGYGMDAQWIDEFHHALRVAAGKDPVGYYSDFDGFIYLGKAFADAYVYDGQYSEHRQKTFGMPARGLAGDRFIVFSQNHDQVGNTMKGDRTSVLVSFEMLKVLAASVVFSPYLPMLFMGEEYAEEQPFRYFVHHSGPELVAAVREGRRKEFEAFFDTDAEVPDPQSEDTFTTSKLRWEKLQVPRHATLFEYYRHIIALRKRSVVLSSGDRNNLEVTVHEPEKVLVVHRWLGEQHTVFLLNFSNAIQSVQVPEVTRLICLVNSSDIRWLGSGADDVRYDAAISLPPASCLLFGSEHV